MSEAKDALFRKIDTYIHERIIIADQVIQETAGNKIKDGDVILTYARYDSGCFGRPDTYLRSHRSSVVEKVLLEAHASGRKFSVIVVDSRPMLEGMCHHLLSHVDTDTWFRQAINSCPLRSRHTVYICPASGSGLSHLRGFYSLRWRALNTHERRRVLTCWHGSCRHVGETALRSCRCLLRDL